MSTSSKRVTSSTASNDDSDEDMGIRIYVNIFIWMFKTRSLLLNIIGDQNLGSPLIQSGPLARVAKNLRIKSSAISCVTFLGSHASFYTVTRPYFRTAIFLESHALLFRICANLGLWGKHALFSKNYREPQKALDFLVFVHLANLLSIQSQYFCWWVALWLEN